MTDLSTTLEFALLIERVHGANHPELTRVRELTEQLARPSDQDTITDLFRELRAVTDNYAVPGDGCEAFTSTYESLKAADLEFAKV